ncbi:hypothetical protein D3C72_1646270 [compost metagenome]
MPDRLIQSESHGRSPDILRSSGFGVDKIEYRVADAVNADEADYGHDKEEEEGL